MGFLLGVEIDNSRVVWIWDSEHSSTRPIKLTTVSENQNKAEIKFYLKKDGSRYYLMSESITDLPAMHAGEPSINIKPRVSDKTFHYDILLNGKRVRSGSHGLRKYLRSKAPFITAAVSAAVIILILLAVFLFIPMLRSSGKTQPAANTPSAANTPTARETPPVNIITSGSAESPEVEESPPETVFIESEITDRHAVYFKPDSAELTADAISGLRDFIGKLPGEGDFEEAEFELEIRGHCAKYGTEEGRAELSRDRALNVYSFLKSDWNIEADSFVSGAGAAEPVSLRRDEQHLNRRVDINIKGNLKLKE
ncbi:MAG: OmpA family protein [Spirochaetales bacterium]|uniref:OmpA family protein n=1 Tax=Candidatus Thalassospirochaeta sargassi TaxID=3119039 RepID=A0AAJ1IJA5_9SPIO|nr:OmpA family protein [Spirochaetales bacterium]